VAHELGDREYLGMIRGEIIWNHQDQRWERRDFDPSHPWWKLGIDQSGSHPASPVPLPKEPPPAHDSLPPNESPGGLTHDQLVRIQQINDLASRGVISDDVRADEANKIAGEGH
jgi:hypothetical protein